MASIMTSLGFSGLGAGDIERHPEVEALPVIRDNNSEAMKRVPSRLIGDSSAWTGEN